MRVLLDTNIIIHREAATVINEDIGVLFNWLDRLHYIKCIHPLSIREIDLYKNEKTKKSISIKLENYNLLKTVAPLDDRIKNIIYTYDKNDNDKNDSLLLNEILNNRVDILITEDKNIHDKAAKLTISNKVFSIATFLRKISDIYPELINYKVLSIRKQFFGNVDLKNDFFQSFKDDYLGFEKWFNNKADEIAYICEDKGNICGFLYLKKEDERENYSDIDPVFERKKRLKIGTFKVTLYGKYLGERFLKIIFDNAIKNRVQEIYLTIFEKSAQQKALSLLLMEWGFILFGVKKSESGEEKVYIRDFSKNYNKENPKITFPYISLSSDIYLVPIYPDYHTELFPDSILKTESPNDFIENEPHRNAISKIYISHSHYRSLNRGDIIIFYRTGGYYKSVITTIGIVESIITNIENEKHLIKLCYGRSVFDKKGLSQIWNKYRGLKPFIVNFLYAYSFPKRPNLKRLIELKILASIEDAPRGFTKITKEQFLLIIKETNTDENIIIS